MSAFESIGFITKENDESAIRLLASLLPTIQKYHRESPKTRLYLDATLKNHKAFKRSASDFSFVRFASLIEKSRLLLTLGGDGTILKAARFLLAGDEWKTHKVLGVNAGHLGFLTFLSAQQARAQLSEIFYSKEAKIEPRTCIEVKIRKKSKAKRSVESFHVLNDCVLSRGSLSRIIDFQVRVDGSFLSTYRADGLILSTPTGSTAYNLAAGGSIIEPSISSLQISPICAQSFSNKPIVISDQHRIEVSFETRAREAYLTLDGHTALPLEAGDRLIVQKSKKSILFLLPPGINSLHYFDSLRQKLKWGLVSSEGT